MKRPRVTGRDGFEDPLGDPEYKALGDFRRAVREFLAFSEQGAADRGLTSQQHQALLAVRAHTGPEPISIGELAQCLMIRPHSAAGLVGRMEDAGLLERIESLADRRRVLLGLTPNGARLLSEISVRNVAQLSATMRIVSVLLRTMRSLERRGLWARKSA